MKKRTKQLGTPIYGVSYTDSHGITLHWSETLKRYVTIPENERTGSPPPETMKIIGAETRYVGSERRHGGFGARIRITSAFLCKTRLDHDKITDADPESDRYFVNDNDRLVELGGLRVGDTVGVHHFDARTGGWGFVEDEIAVENVELFSFLGSKKALSPSETAPSRPEPPSLDAPQSLPVAPERDPADRLRGDLCLALDSLLAALEATGGVPADLPLPDKAFDKALKADPDHEAAKAAFVTAYKAVFVVLPDDAARRRLLRLEEAATNLAVQAAAVGWRLGLMAGGAEKKGLKR
jgi:hypothetical protein